MVPGVRSSGQAGRQSNQIKQMASRFRESFAKCCAGDPKVRCLSSVFDMPEAALDELVCVVVVALAGAVPLVHACPPGLAMAGIRLARNWVVCAI